MESSQHHYKHNSRITSGLSTIPSLSISTSTSCASSVLSTSPAISDSPYYYYTSPASVSSSPTTSIANPPPRQSYRSLEKRSHSASVRLPRRTSPLLPPQRSASAGSTLLKDSSSSIQLQQEHRQRRLTYASSSYPTTDNNLNDNSKILPHSIIDDSNSASTPFDQIPVQQQQRWDDSQLAMELADDLPTSPTSSTRENIKIKVRQWITPSTKQRRRPIHKWFSDRMA